MYTLGASTLAPASLDLGPSGLNALHPPLLFYTPSLHFLEICLVAATQAWNTVPLDVKAALSLAAFGQTQTVCFMRCFLVADRPN